MWWIGAIAPNPPYVHDLCHERAFKCLGWIGVAARNPSYNINPPYDRKKHNEINNPNIIKVF